MRKLISDQDALELGRENICDWDFSSLVAYYLKSKSPRMVICILLHLQFCSSVDSDSISPEWFVKHFGEPFHHEEDRDGEMQIFYSFAPNHIIVINFTHERFVEFFTTSQTNWEQSGLPTEFKNWGMRTKRPKNIS